MRWILLYCVYIDDKIEGICCRRPFIILFFFMNKLCSSIIGNEICKSKVNATLSRISSVFFTKHKRKNCLVLNLFHPYLINAMYTNHLIDTYSPQCIIFLEKHLLKIKKKTFQTKKLATGIARSISPGQSLRQTSTEINTFNTTKVSKKLKK